MIAPGLTSAQPAGAPPRDGDGKKPVIANDESSVVQTADGKLRGYRRDGVYIFKGVPYGASTGGARRFMPPQKPEPWAGIRNALQYGHACPNRNAKNIIVDSNNSAAGDEDAFLLHRGANAPVLGEDCLSLNVWTPAIDRGKRPVMVFMHGGGYSSGNAAELLSYDGENLARHHDVVVITHNHRVNVFGYLNLSKLGGDAFAESANVGLLDLVAVLEWVKTNASQFGGDPGSVTIFGQSGGGGKVLGLMTMPAAQGLFHRAIVQSGPYLRALQPAYSERVAELVMDELGLAHNNVGELQHMAAERLHAASSVAMAKMPDAPSGALRRHFGTTGWGPTADGHVLPQHYFEPGAPSISGHVPLITGTNLHEFINGVDRTDANTMSWPEARSLVQKGLGSGDGKGDDQVDAIIAAYRKEYPEAHPFDIYATIAASSVRQGGFEQARRKAALHAAPVWSYLYSWRTPTLDDRPGVFHAAELAMVFDNAELCDHYTCKSPDALNLAKQMSAAWVAFARTGNPNHRGLPDWPAFTEQQPAVMVFNTDLTVKTNPEAEGLRLILGSA